MRDTLEQARLVNLLSLGYKGETVEFPGTCMFYLQFDNRQSL